jgi:hypothetical protein
MQPLEASVNEVGETHGDGTSLRNIASHNEDRREIKVNRHTKASSAGSSEGNGRGQGLLRLACAARGLSGSGAPSGRPSRIAVVFGAALALVLVFGVMVASAAAPVVSVNNASSVEYTTAHVSGEVDPQSQPTTYRFQYISEAQQQEDVTNGLPEWEFAATAKEETIEGASQPVEVDMTGLAPGTTYHLRLVAENGEGSTEAVAASTFTTEAVAQPTVSIEAPSSITGTTAHFAGHVEPNAPAGNPAAFDVDWHFECTPECPGLSGAHITADSSSHTVEADASGLIPGTAYEVTLFATNAGGTATAGPEGFSASTLAPQIQGVKVVPSITEATLLAQINPGGLQTTYHFEYGPSASYGQSTPSTVIPAGGTFVSVEARIMGLSSSSGYHFRLVTENSIETVTSADQAFTTNAQAASTGNCPNEINRTGLSAVLPDCRAYEEVSPANKSGNDAGAIRGFGEYAYGTPDGNAIFYTTRGPMGAAQRGLSKAATSRRTATGWTTEGALPSGSAGRLAPAYYSNLNIFPAADISKIAFTNPTSLVPANPSSEGMSDGLYLADTSSRSLEWVSEPHTPNPVPAPGNIISSYAFIPEGGSPDLSTLYFLAAPTLLPGDIEGAPGMYEYSKGQLKSAGTLPDGTLDPGGALPANAAPITAFTQVWPEEFAGQVSADGSRLYFLSGGELYVRRDGVSHLVSHSELTGEKAPSGVTAPPGLMFPRLESGVTREAVFGTADGSVAYFESTDQLTGAAPSDGSVKMYRYDVASGSVTYVPGVEGTIVAASDDGQRFLFANPGISVWDHGTIIPVAENGSASMRPAQATPSGSEFVFTTDASLPGFNNGGVTQVYHYDLATRTTVCVSCPPAGIVSSGAVAMSSNEGPGHGQSAEGPHVRGNRGMSEDGRRVFFDTPDPLVPRDVNGRRDVYEWSEGNGVTLITSGTSEEDSFFLDSSANGDDVFFTTTAGLVAGDTDGQYDVYDARVGGGFQSSSEVAACSGDGCQGVGSAPSVFGAPGSVTFSGAGNPALHAVVKAKPKPLTRAQKLAKALKACHKVKAKRARASCEKKAHRAFGPVKHKPKAKSHEGGK